MNILLSIKYRINYNLIISPIEQKQFLNVSLVIRLKLVFNVHLNWKFLQDIEHAPPFGSNAYPALGNRIYITFELKEDERQLGYFV